MGAFTDKCFQFLSPSSISDLLLEPPAICIHPHTLHPLLASILVFGIMRFPGRFGGRVGAIIGLITISVIAIVSIGEGFKAFLVRRDGIKLDRRDGSSTVNLDMP